GLWLSRQLARPRHDPVVADFSDRPVAILGSVKSSNEPDLENRTAKRATLGDAGPPHNPSMFDRTDPGRRDHYGGRDDHGVCPAGSGLHDHDPGSNRLNLPNANPDHR